MFTFSCTTCEAKLVAKNDDLTGKVLACPNCGSMVLVQPPEKAPVPPPHPPKPVIHKRFPDILSHATASGIIGYVPEENRLSDILLEPDSEPGISETEVKTRKFLVGLFLGLLAFLLLLLGFLMVFQKDMVPSIPVQEPVIPAPVEPFPTVPDSVPEENIVVPPSDEEPVDISPLPEPLTEPEPIPQVPTESDTLSAFEDKMPGFVDISLPNIDIHAKLALPIHELNLEQSSLVGFIRAMSRMTEIPMTLDIDEMKLRGLSVSTPISGQFSEATVEKILTETLATLGLQWKVADRQILIFPKAIDEAVELTFDVSDFTDAAEVLADTIQKLVAPESVVTVLNDRLTVSQNESRQRSRHRQREDVLRFLEQLRAVRHLPQKTKLSGETLAPEAFGWDRVMEPMTLNYYQAISLSRATAQLESLTHLTILVDHQSLHRFLCSFASLQGRVQCDQGTVNDALELLLASVDSVALTYRIIDEQTLEITTAESARQPEKMAVEIHPYRLQEGETAEDIIRLLRSAVAPETWATELPESKYGGNIVIDEPSGCLLIRQSQPVQRQIRLYLSESVL